MHIEPGLVDGAKIVLSYATAAAAGSYTVKAALDAVRDKGLFSLVVRSAIATAAVFCFFHVLPHYPIGVSEVHFILGSSLFLILGAAPAAIGLALALLLQGVLFEPKDLPQYGMNVTTLLVPLFALRFVAQRAIAANTAYVDLTYRQALALSTTYQGGVIAWVAFWAFYGGGFGAENIASVASFGAAYTAVVLIEPLVDLALLAAAKALRGLDGSPLVVARLYRAA
ncbi:MAG: cobalt transporter [Hyphomicrobium sp.]|nr:cobalt transporter [Sphingomonas sp.]MBA4100530.1 cobalt transporter [Rhodospirillum sp.]MBA4172248.1 cobalt transporter [Hyphomicrobium sp.]